MVGKVISDYMEGGAKKLTVPGFGTFMRREGGIVIFVDLLRGDDHLLRELVEDRGNYSEVEAMALVDRFIFEIRHAIESRGSAVIEGFGTMTLDRKGVYQFQHSPRVLPVREHAVQERLFRPEPASAQPRRNRPPVEKPGRKPRGKKFSRMDIVLVVAITAAVIALIALAFGMTAGNMPFLQDR